METFKGMSFINDKGTQPYSRILRCSGVMKQQSAIYMANVVKFVDPEPVLPILPEYNIQYSHKA